MARANIKYEVDPIPWSSLRAGLVEREQLGVRRGHVPHAAEGEKSSTTAPIGHGQSQAARGSPPDRQEPRVTMRKVIPRRAMSATSTPSRGDPEERTVDGRVHPRIERGKGMLILVRTRKIVIASSQARPLCPRSRRLQWNRRRRPGPRPKSSSADASSYERIKGEIGPVANRPPNPDDGAQGPARCAISLIPGPATATSATLGQPRSTSPTDPRSSRSWASGERQVLQPGLRPRGREALRNPPGSSSRASVSDRVAG